MASSFKSPILQAIDQNGNPVPGAKLFAFASGTTTPVVIYSNQSLTTPLPNPLIANARGYFASAGGIVQNIWWDGQALRLRLTDPDDNVIWEIDDYSAASGVDPAANINVTGIWAGANARSLAALKARSVTGLTGGEVIQLNAGGRSGQFAWVTGNQSAAVTADPAEIEYVPPSSDVTGASGAWRRQGIGNQLLATWAGIPENDAGAVDRRQALAHLIAYANGREIILPAGNIRVTRSGNNVFFIGVNDVTIRGAGKSKTTLQLHDTTTSFCTWFRQAGERLALSDMKIDLNVPATHESAFVTQEKPDLTWERLEISGNIVSNSHLFYCHRPTSNEANNFVMRDVEVYGVTRVFLKSVSNQTNNSRYKVLGNCYFHDNHTIDFDINTPNYLSSWSDFYVEGARFEDNVGTLGGGDVPVFLAFASASNCRVVGAHFQGTCEYAVNIEDHSRNIYIDNCTADVDGEAFRIFNARKSGLKQVVLTSSPIASAGTGYKINDILTISGGTLATVINGEPLNTGNGTLRVTTVGGSGEVTGVVVQNAAAYIALPSTPVTPTGGSGSGAQFNLETGTAADYSARPENISVNMIARKIGSKAGTYGGRIVFSSQTGSRASHVSISGKLIGFDTGLQVVCEPGDVIKLPDLEIVNCVRGLELRRYTSLDAEGLTITGATNAFDVQNGGIIRSPTLADCDNVCTFQSSNGALVISDMHRIFNGAVVQQKSTLSEFYKWFPVAEKLRRGTGQATFFASAGGIVFVELAYNYNWDGVTFTGSNAHKLFASSIDASGALIFRVATVAISAAGTGYTAGDVLTIAGGTIQNSENLVPATVTVDTVGGAGEITGVSVAFPSGYTAAPSTPNTVTGGTGTGAQLNLTFDRELGFELFSSVTRAVPIFSRIAVRGDLVFSRN
jgi:hypothetical protein